MLIVEDGSIVTGANSYISESEYSAWANARFGDSRETLPANDAAIEALVLRAMDYFEQLNFIGRKQTQDQPLQWPRSFVVIDGYGIQPDTIPDEVKNAIYELTYAEEKGEGELNTIDRKAESEKVGPIAVTYSTSSASREINPSVGRALRKILAFTGMRVYRI